MVLIKTNNGTVAFLKRVVGWFQFLGIGHILTINFSLKQTKMDIDRVTSRHALPFSCVK